MAIAFDNSEQGDTTTLNHLCTGSNLCLFVACCQYRSGSPPSEPTATYNSVSMSVAGSVTVTNFRLTLFYLKNPNTGSAYEIAISTDADETVLASASYTGVDQTTPVDLPGTTQATADTTMNQDVTSESGDWVVDCMGEYDLGTITAVETEREINNNAAANESVGLQDKTSTGATTNMQWNWETFSNCMQVSVNVNAAAASTRTGVHNIGGGSGTRVIFGG